VWAGLKRIGALREDRCRSICANLDLRPRVSCPCWDEPEFKIPWQLTLVVPKAHRTVANTPVASERAAQGRKTVVFRETKPMIKPLVLVSLIGSPVSRQ
jgi:hypothetical protein